MQSHLVWLTWRKWAIAKDPSHRWLAVVILTIYLSRHRLRVMTDDLLPAYLVEEQLSMLFPEREGYWRQFLINNRRASRNPPFRLQFEVIAGRPFYNEASVERFIQYERLRRNGTHVASAPDAAKPSAPSHAAPMAELSSGGGGITISVGRCQAQLSVQAARRLATSLLTLAERAEARECQGGAQ